jgi:phosphinothricin acetyltransferase
MQDRASASAIHHLPARRVAEARPCVTAQGVPAIRAARTADLPAVTRILAQAADRAGRRGGPAPMLHEIAAMRERLVARGYPCVVAEQGDGIIGFAFAAPFSERHGWQAVVEGTLCVDAAARGVGAGKALLRALLDACTARGFRRMLAVLDAGPEGAAPVALHRGLGFVEAGVLHGLGADDADVVLLQRDLADAPTGAAAA